MRIFFIVFVLLFSQLSFGCDSVSGVAVKLKLESMGNIILCNKGDGDGDGVDDAVALIKNGDSMSFVLVLSSSEGKILQSKSMPLDGCQGGCGVENVYFKKGSVFLQRGEKYGSTAAAKTFQFKLYGEKFKLIGVKLKVFSSDEENPIEEITDDVNWSSGKRIKTTKYANGKVTSENVTIETYELLFENFELGAVPLR